MVSNNKPPWIINPIIFFELRIIWFDDHLFEIHEKLMDFFDEKKYNFSLVIFNENYVKIKNFLCWFLYDATSQLMDTFRTSNAHKQRKSYFKSFSYKISMLILVAKIILNWNTLWQSVSYQYWVYDVFITSYGHQCSFSAANKHKRILFQQ